MDRDQAAHLLQSLEEELEEVRAAQREHARRADALRKLIAGYLELYPELEEEEEAKEVESAEPIPRGQDAVESVLRNWSGVWLNTRQVVEDMEKRGWLPESRDPAAAVRAALQRAYDDPDSLIFKETWPDYGVMWAYDPPNDEEEYESFDPDAADEERLRAEVNEAEVGV